MEGLSTLVNLRVLDVSSNKLTSVNDIQNLTQYVWSSLLRIMLSLIRFISLLDSRHAYRLEDLWLNDNQIESLEGVSEAVVCSREKLTTIYLENNPCVRYSLTWKT
jgi:protein phosphatase 1 regulatory subunit 7